MNIQDALDLSLNEEAFRIIGRYWLRSRSADGATCDVQANPNGARSRTLGGYLGGVGALHSHRPPPFRKESRGRFFFHRYGDGFSFVVQFDLQLHKSRGGGGVGWKRQLRECFNRSLRRNPCGGYGGWAIGPRCGGVSIGLAWGWCCSGFGGCRLRCRSLFQRSDYFNTKWTDGI